MRRLPFTHQTMRKEILKLWDHVTFAFYIPNNKKSNGEAMETCDNVTFAFSTTNNVKSNVEAMGACHNCL